MRPTQIAQPKDVKHTVWSFCKTEIGEQRFNILRENRFVRLENLVLNRNSLAQTVEILFALSFLVKDGRAEIKVNENGWQLVSPRNSPSANTVLSGEVAHVFRYDLKDWKVF
ncbi:hypothetical protein QN277_009801 [Acacia crassicarpa]|uniref:Non-structural maintenance of chromosomes element 4 n=1 Tax=Acacia crassicarpa TaxID=499986 RepID=A0AAE1IQ01_9FABA|nr:hypothetical protein QN277_009801 [Acacia crassicarpa]